MKRIISGAFLLLVLIAPGAWGEPCDGTTTGCCKVTDLDCWGPDKKCNIKFKNNTGEASGSSGGHGEQKSWARDVKVSARKADGSRAGGNTLYLNAGESKTMNLDKKDGFSKIRLDPVDLGAGEVNLKCDQVRQVLDGSGRCKIWFRQSGIGEYLAVTCDGGNVYCDTSGCEES